MNRDKNELAKRKQEQKHVFLHVVRSIVCFHVQHLTILGVDDEKSRETR